MNISVSAGFIILINIYITTPGHLFMFLDKFFTGSLLKLLKILWIIIVSHGIFI